MIASFSEILRQEEAAGRAVGAFTCYELSTALGVLHAAEDADVPVILLVSCASFTTRGGELFAAALLAAARQARAPACVQLDHVSELEIITRAVDLGIGAVMADGSRLALTENVQLVREAVRLGRQRGSAVEAELGRIEGEEDVASAGDVGALTDPDEAAEFIAQSGAHCLAVSIGNIHGTYVRPPALDWQRLDRIRGAVEAPLSLHGASGLPPADLAHAVRSGIVKVNVNTELRRRAFEELSARLPELEPGYRMLELQTVLAAAASEVAAASLAALRGGT